MFTVLASSGLGHAVFAQAANPSNPLPVPDAVRDAHLVHVAPHVLRFNDTTRSATLTFSNTGDYPIHADVLVLFAYMTYPHGAAAETTLITPHWETIFPRDTVVLAPGPHDQFAGRWLSGPPTQVTLKPHTSQQVTVHVAPPPHLPAGEYWARVVTVVHPPDPKHGPTKDTRQTYRVPLKATAPVVPALRDSALVFYDQGTLTMGLAIDHSIAAIDTADFPAPPYEGGGHHQLWYKEHIRVTGNAPFDGVVRNTFHNIDTGQDVTLTSEGLTISRDETLHSWSQADMLAPGRYLLIVTYDSPNGPIPMTPAVDTIPFIVPQHD